MNLLLNQCLHNMKFIPYTLDDSLKDWIKQSKNKKRKYKQFGSKHWKNLKNG